MASFLTEFLDAIPSPWLYALGFAVAFLESTPALGLVVPGQTVLFTAGFVSGEGLLDPVALCALVAVGGFIGDALGYELGRHYGLGPLQRLPRRIRPGERAEGRLQALFHHHGMKAIVLACFQPIGRAFGPYTAGASDMPRARFYVADVVASIVAGAGMVMLGFLAGKGFERLSRTLGVTAVILVTLLLIAVIALGLRAKHRREGDPHD